MVKNKLKINRFQVVFMLQIKLKSIVMQILKSNPRRAIVLIDSTNTPQPAKNKFQKLHTAQEAKLP